MIKIIRRIIQWFKIKFGKKMRRRISLYIDNQLVDLDDESFILFNYTQEETTDPAIVRNSFSQQITLKGTPTNNQIFGNIYRMDRQTQYGSSMSGIYFDPTRKTPFVIYDEMSEVLESGYIKLDKVSRRFSRYEYTITLFGGLGSFFYGLSYDEEGNKRTLADLHFLGTDRPETELNFQISKDSVLGAWKRLNGDVSQSAVWDIINFAPAYNGYPTGTFDADKALVNAANAGLKTVDGQFYTRNGFVLVSLSKSYTEWETKDLRSYLQRPVIKVSAIIEAICNPTNNGGYEVELDEDFFNENNPYFADAWLTLPVINTLDVEIEQGGGNLILLEDSNIIIPDGGNLTTQYNVDLNFIPSIYVDESPSGDLYMHTMEVYADGETNRDEYYMNWIEYTATAYNSSNNVLTQSIVRVSSRQTNATGLIPEIDVIGHFNSNGFWMGQDIHIHLEAVGIHHVVFRKRIMGASYGSPRHEVNTHIVWTDDEHYEPNYLVTSYFHMGTTGGSKYTYITSTSARSGATITKRNLLSSDKTPADYLLSYCKMFGLQFFSDKRNKRIQIIMRKNLYNGDTIDLTNRIDIERGIEKVPFAFDAKWYDFGVKYENGEFAKYYQNIYSQDFGLQRVNTGYGFNADSKDVMESVIFSGATEVLENGKYYMDIVQSGKNIPSVFLDSGATYSLYKGNGDTQEYDVPVPNASAVRTWLNPSLPTYDLFSKLQLHNEDNAAFDERDTLVLFRGMKSLTSERFAVTDDNTDMMMMNENTPCWWLDYQLIDPSCKVTFLPMFSRYVWSGTSSIIKSLDFGTPSEVQIPNLVFKDNSSIYDQYWKNYVSDRYDDDSAVITCYVDLSGLQVNESLFRNFYYFDGAIWALNRIINHSMTTFDPTECEFIKVQDRANYTAEPISPYYLTAGTNNINTNKEQTSFNIDISANVAWRAESNVNWASVMPTTGAGNQTLQLFIDENTSAEQRSGVITIYATDNPLVPSFAISLRQYGEETGPVEGEIKILKANSWDTSEVVESGTGYVYPDVISSGAWTATSNAAWCHNAQGGNTWSGQESHRPSAEPIWAYIDANTTGQQRTAIITARLTGTSLFATYVVTQNA